MFTGVTWIRVAGKWERQQLDQREEGCDQQDETILKFKQGADHWFDMSK